MNSNLFYDNEEREVSEFAKLMDLLFIRYDPAIEVENSRKLFRWLLLDFIYYKMIIK